MVLDILFLVVLIFFIIRGKKRGIISVLLGVGSTLLAIILAITLHNVFAVQIEDTEIYNTARETIIQKLSEEVTIGESEIFSDVKEKGIEQAANGVMSATITAIIFLISIIIIKALSFAVKGFFKLPVLSFFNGTLGMLWSAVVIIFITYILLIMAQGFLDENSFVMTQINSSYLLKFMYDNNFIYMMFSKGEKV